MNECTIRLELFYSLYVSSDYNYLHQSRQKSQSRANTLRYGKNILLESRRIKYQAQ